MACGISSSGRVRSELRSWRLRTGSWSWRTPGASTPAPRSSNATDFSSLRLTASTRADVISYLRNWRYRRTAAYRHEADLVLQTKLPNKLMSEVGGQSGSALPIPTCPVRFKGYRNGLFVRRPLSPRKRPFSGPPGQLCGFSHSHEDSAFVLRVFARVENERLSPAIECSSGQGQGDCFPCEGDLICQPTSGTAKLRQL